MEKPTFDKFIHKTDKTQPKPQPKAYRAKRGDTRPIIAEKFGISIETLTRLNPQIEYWGDLEGKTLNVHP